VFALNDPSKRVMEAAPGRKRMHDLGLLIDVGSEWKRAMTVESRSSSREALGSGREMDSREPRDHRGPVDGESWGGVWFAVHDKSVGKSRKLGAARNHSRVNFMYRRARDSVEA
jgi:hypothetical protein